MNIIKKTAPGTSFLLLALVISGCSTSQETLLPVDENTTMMSIWSRHGGGRSLADARSQLRRPLTTITAQEQQGYPRTAANEVQSQFRRLPNPDMVMYVYPHLSGSEGVPVPGYSTVFPLYTQVRYALPGERTEAL